jgi:hypothetical protein
MRASEIKNLLIQKFGVDPATIAKIMDRAELKQMLMTFMIDQQTKDSRDAIISSVMHYLYIFAGCVLFFLAFQPIIGLLRSIRSNDNKALFKIKLLSTNLKKKNYTGALSLALSFLLDVVSSAMTISTFLSWVLPYSSPFRAYMVPMLSFPVDTAMIQNIARGGHARPNNPFAPSGPASSSFGFDVGPMITIAAIKWLSKFLEEYSAGTVMHSVRSREEKRAKKQFRKQFGLDAQGKARSSPVTTTTTEDDAILSDEWEHVQHDELPPQLRRRNTAKTTSSDPENSTPTEETVSRGETYRDTSHLYSKEDELEVCAAAAIASMHDEDDDEPPSLEAFVEDERDNHPDLD